MNPIAGHGRGLPFQCSGVVEVGARAVVSDGLTCRHLMSLLTFRVCSFPSILNSCVYLSRDLSSKLFKFIVLHDFPSPAANFVREARLNVFEYDAL